MFDLPLVRELKTRRVLFVVCTPNPYEARMQQAAGKLTVFDDPFGFALDDFVIIIWRNGPNWVDNTIDTKTKLSDRNF